MNPLKHYLARRRLEREQKRKAEICRRLEATMRPNPQSRINRLRQFPPKRQAEYWRNVEGIGA